MLAVLIIAFIIFVFHVIQDFREKNSKNLFGKSLIFAETKHSTWENKRG